MGQNASQIYFSCLGNRINLHLEEYQGAVKKKNEPENPLKDLHNRMEEEKHELIKQLKGKRMFFFGNPHIYLFKLKSIKGMHLSR